MGKRKEIERVHQNQPVLKYSDIIGSWFYNIGLSDVNKQMVDIYFFCAAHHYYRWRGATEPIHKDIHLTRHQLALKELISVVYQNGDFSRAYDPLQKGLDEREAWNPENLTIPDPRMFDSQAADHRYPLGRKHPFDIYLLELGPGNSDPHINVFYIFIIDTNFRHTRALTE